MARASGSTVPFTPRPERRKSSNRYGISDQEFTKYTKTLASVRRVRPGDIKEELERSGDSPALAAQLGKIKISRQVETIQRDHTGGSERDRRALSPRGQERERERERDRVRERPSSVNLRRLAHEQQHPRPSSSASLRRDRDRDLAEGPHIHSHERERERDREGAYGSRESDRASARHEVNRNIEVEIAVIQDITSPEATPAPPERLLDGVPLEVQEAWICEDLMFVLQGVEGSLIRYAHGYDPQDADQRLRGAQWSVDPSLDPSLLSLVNRLLPIATFFTSVEASIELRNSSDCGMVSHALASGMRGMLKEYRVLIARLEALFLSSSTFTLQTLYSDLHPTLHTMSLLSSMCLALETEDDGDADSDSDDDELDGIAGELVGGAGLKGLMNNLKAKDGLIGGGGPVLGGEVLGIVCEREATMTGDPTAKSLHSHLLLHASQPYCRMLLRWISTGYLHDPYEEFMVKESGHITKGVLEIDYTDEYWDGRYTLRDGSSLTLSSKGHGGKNPTMNSAAPPPRQGTTRLPGGACIPSFLQPWKQKILLAGKYLNVIRECGIEVKKPGEIDAEEGNMVVMNEAKFYKRIEDAYIYANQTLLKLLVEEQELIPHLRSLKHYFFADQSDFLTNFLDLASSDLTRKAAKSVSIVKLQSLLDLAVRNPASSSSNDPYKDNLKVTMASQGLYEWLLKIVTHTGSAMEDGQLDFGQVDYGGEHGKRDGEAVLMGIDAVTFDYSVRFPLSLVISRKAITRYQLIFRFLVPLHHLESALSAMWLEHKAPTWRDRTGNADMDQWKGRVFALRARMLTFVRQMLAYATGEVLEPNWRSLEAKLAKVGTVDQLMRDHVDFLDTCLKQCMLTNSKLLSVYSKLMKTMAAFVSYQESFNKALVRFRADPITESDATKATHRWTVLHKFEINFNHHTNLLLDAVTYQAGSENPALLALVARLHNTTMRM